MPEEPVRGRTGPDTRNDVRADDGAAPDRPRGSCPVAPLPTARALRPRPVNALANLRGQVPLQHLPGEFAARPCRPDSTRRPLAPSVSGPGRSRQERRVAGPPARFPGNPAWRSGRRDRATAGRIAPCRTHAPDSIPPRPRQALHRPLSCRQEPMSPDPAGTVASLNGTLGVFVGGSGFPRGVGVRRDERPASGPPAKSGVGWPERQGAAPCGAAPSSHRSARVRRRPPSPSPPDAPSSPSSR
jgi:hypothetical protein